MQEWDGSKFQVSSNPPPYPFYSPLRYRKSTGLSSPIEKGGGVAERTHIFIQESLAAFYGGRAGAASLRHSIHVESTGKPGGFFGGRAGATSLRLIIFILYKNSQNK